ARGDQSTPQENLGRSDSSKIYFDGAVGGLPFSTAEGGGAEKLGFQKWVKKILNIGTLGATGVLSFRRPLRLAALAFAKPFVRMQKVVASSADWRETASHGVG